MPFEENSSNNNNLTPISHDKMTSLGINCVIMNNFMDAFFEKTDLSDVLCEECFNLSGKISKVNYQKYQSVLKPPIQIGIFLQRSENNFVRY